VLSKFSPAFVTATGLWLIAEPTLGAREEMGLDPVEGGDKLGGAQPSPFGQFGQRPRGLFEEREEPEKEEKAIATTQGSAKHPLSLENMETPSTYKDMARQILNLMKEQKRRIFDIITAQGKESQLVGIKALEDHIEKIKGAVSADSIKQIVMDIIKNTFFGTITSQELKFNMNFVPRANVIDFLQKSAFESVKNMTEEIANRVSQKVRQGVVEGWGITKLKKSIDEVFKKHEGRAEMIARTEVLRADNKAMYETYEQAGVEADVEWVAKIDSRTCPTCRDLDGKTVKLNTKFKSFAGQGFEGFHPTAHPQCRCVTVLRPRD